MALSVLDGWIILDKPLGLGSTQGVSAVKRVARQCGLGKVKVGHGGTLDPLATGVLPIALGEATKLTGRMLDADKTYDFTIAFGTQTDTLDLEGAVIATSDARPTMADVAAVLARFTGPIAQVPPAYSALKVDGARAYDLARAGEEVVLASRNVTVHSLTILPGTGRGTAAEGGGGGGSPPAQRFGDSPLHQPAAGPPPRAGEELAAITLSATVSKGTYIRSLARDIALALGTVGHVSMLRRTRAGPFTLDQAISLDNLNQAATARALEDVTLPMTAGLDGIPALSVSRDQAGALRQGRILRGMPATPGLNLAVEDDLPVALVEAIDGEIRVVRGFNLMPKETIS
ncbi:tRNA pseudouridine(55) synthase TruB [Sphingomonas naphthae]|uniref:tRNA pseudouridine synthase B n=1 Tax=Sphingomonas naphthae TaxID=1813468 RepID=A0ABY7TSI8_9SPHN|nr:tRNA pseudouridine(55) synthase TruB [Sphingomonas naphthae]WCT75370.1 tRNA pseudouridine(55) synthase TruB [Sphingomonas naphthae]